MSNHGDASLSLAGFKQVCVFTVQLCIFSVADFRSSLAKDKYFSLGVELVIWAKTRIQAFTLEERWQSHYRSTNFDPQLLNFANITGFPKKNLQ